MVSFNPAEVLEHVSVSPLSGDFSRMIEYYRYFNQIVGLLIIVTNLSVVVTSGLILKKAVQPKSTYMLLGNISMADTVLGVAMIFWSFADKSLRDGTELEEDWQTHTICLVIQGLRMCPASVSILSIGLIAADRYIYLIHGLYYKSWVSARRVRIAIVCTWIIGAIFTIPGWLNMYKVKRCYFTDIYPIEQMLTMAAISFVIIVFVTTLYTIILVKAVKANNKIQKAKKNAQISTIRDKLNDSQNTKSCDSLDNSDNNNIYIQQECSLNDVNLTIIDVKETKSKSSVEPSIFIIDVNPNPPISAKSSVVELTLYEDSSNLNKDNDKQDHSSIKRSVSSIMDVNQVQNKRNENKKCRAITVVVLTTGCFIISWLPFMASVVYYGYVCERLSTKEDCEKSCEKTVRALWIMALLNSLVNPFIYAWWHHGFKEHVKSCYKKCFRKVV